MAVIDVKLSPQVNRSGDAGRAAQGFGRVSRAAPPAFDPWRDIDSACAYFSANGFVVLSRCFFF
jgi:hypothetical protein